jgi:hypothetical protein
MHFKILLFSYFCIYLLPVKAQTTEMITGKYIEFIGGEKNWTKVKTMITSGEYDYGGISFPFKTYAMAPNRYKFIVESNGKYYAQGFDGVKGWKIDVFKNETAPTILNGPEATSMANESSVELMDVIVRSKINGLKTAYSGTDSVRSHFCHRITLVENGMTDTLFFDTKSYELVMKKTLSKNAELQKAPLKIYYSDYRDIGGIKIPFKTICESNEQVILIITLNRATLDVPIEANEFQP